MAPTDVDDEFEPVYHRYTPHRAGLPPLVPYFRELWARREFAAEMSKASLRSSNVNTVFGQLWLILNPMLLAGVYYLLVTIIRQRHDPALFTHLVLALFALASSWPLRRLLRCRMATAIALVWAIAHP